MAKDVLYQDKKGAVMKIKMMEVDNYFGIKTTVFEKIESVNKQGFLNYKVLDRTRKKTQKFGVKNFVNFTDKKPPIKYFFGRTEELKTLRRWIGAKKPKIIIIYGFAGMGKTTLALELMNNYIANTNTFWKGIHEWSTIIDILQSLSEFLFQMNKNMLKNYLDSHKIIKLNEVEHILEEELKEVEALFIFDDCHQANEKITQFLFILKDIVKKTNKINMILLSRNELPIYDLREVEEEKLVAEMQLEDLDDESAIQFLRTRKIKDSKINEIFEIIKGYPIALNFVQVTKIKKLDKNVIMASANKFLYSQVYSKLSRNEKKILKALSVYRTPISHEVLLFEDSIKYETLEKLIEKSILKETINDEYTMHNIIKEFILNQLGPIERKRYHTLAAEFYGKMDDDFSLRESMYHYLKAEKFGKVSELLIKNGAEIIKKGYCENLKMILGELTENKVPKKYQAKILLIKGKVKTLLGEWDDALNLFNLCIEEEKEATKTQSQAYRGIGYIWTERGKWEKALDNYKNSLRISKIVNDKEGLSEVYRLLGYIYRKKSNYKESFKQLDKSFKIAKEIGDIAEIGKVYLDIGILQHRMNNHEEAHKNFKKSLKLLKKSDCIVELGRVLNSLGASYFSQNDYKKALELFEKCVENSKKSGNRNTEAYGLLNICGCYIEFGRFGKAIEYCNQGIKIFEELKNSRMVASCYLELGKISRLQKEWDKSINNFMNSLDIFKTLNLPYYIARNNYEIGLLYYDMGKDKKAIEFFNKGLRIAKEKKITIYIQRINDQLNRISIRQ